MPHRSPLQCCRGSASDLTLTEWIARGLVEAREAAGLSQSALARKLKVSQSMVANTEAGRTKVSERYVARVLKACRLPKDWTGPTKS